MKFLPAVLIVATLALPAIAQMPVPGAANVSRVAAGSYAVDPRHSQVAWAINHFGFSTYDGIFGGVTGTMTLDPATPGATTITVEVPVGGLVTTVPALDTHLKSPDFFDAAKFPTVTFRSTGVTVTGTHATIAGLLTLHGVTKPVTLDARLIGAGTNPMSKKATVGFAATASIKRSDFGMTFLLQALGDAVELHINAAFERVG